MQWILFSFAASITYACVIFVDKYLLEKEVRDYNVMPIYMGIVSIIFAVCYFMLTGIPNIPLRDATLIACTGIIISYAGLFYFKATSQEEASHINILIQSVPLMTLVLAFLFLQEKIALQQLVGFALILGAALGISYQKDSGKLTLSPGFFLMMGYCFLWAVSSIMIKFVLGDRTFTDILGFESVGIAIGAIFLYIGSSSIRKSFHTTHSHLSNRARGVMLVNEGLSIFAKSLGFYAISLGPVALVSVLIEGTQAFFAIGIGILLTLIFPRIFKEDISRAGLGLKATCASLALVGIWLLS